MSISSADRRWTGAVNEGYDAACRSSMPLAPGARVVVEVVLAGTFPGGQPRPGVQVSSNSPDPQLGDDVRYVTVPGDGGTRS